MPRVRRSSNVGADFSSLNNFENWQNKKQFVREVKDYFNPNVETISNIRSWNNRTKNYYGGKKGTEMFGQM